MNVGLMVWISGDNNCQLDKDTAVILNIVKGSLISTPYI
jgi:hypothetical protein